MGTSEAVFVVPAERSKLADIRDFVELRARAAGAPSKRVDDLIQAVDELATNAIVHGYRDGPGEIEVVFTAHPEAITVTLRDRAPVFDSTQVPEPDIHLPLALRPVGGLGIYLVRRCVDRFEHCERPGGGNELKIVVRLHPD